MSDSENLRLPRFRAGRTISWLAALLLAMSVAACGAQAPEPDSLTATPVAIPTAETTPVATPRRTPRPTAKPTPNATPRVTPDPTPEPTAPPLALPDGAITATEAATRIGEWVTACGTVSTATYAIDSAGAPTFLNLDGAYPDQTLTLVIWDEDRTWYPTAPELAFGPPAQVCAEGIVETYNGKAEIKPATPITLLADWASASAFTGDLDCAQETDPFLAEICWDLQAEWDQLNEEAYYDALDDIHGDPYEDWYDPYAP